MSTVRCVVLGVLLGSAVLPVTAQKVDQRAPVRSEEMHHPVLWHDPGRIAGLDLLRGQGGKDGMPAPPFAFEGEDRDGSTPKFDARDTKGRKWRVKLGQEARPEVAASRLLWAAGYFADDDYVVSKAYVSGLKMRRGRRLVHKGVVDDARFARKPEGQRKIGIWRWKKNRFTGTREFNGLRVMMAVLNSWDLKDENNAVFRDEKTGRELFLVSDVGASFGRTGLHFTSGASKSQPKAYARSKFILKRTETYVDFATPSRSWSLLAETFGFGA
ncbi:MAG TPA: hypothetical protein VM865_05875, partial [Acidobacteriaceae bacterium]|nr:hypothetical protein [Acidobacteriaceae bacterium]